MASRVELSEARAALRKTSRRTAELLGAVGDTTARVKGSDWNVGEVGAHLVVVLRGFTYAARGELDRVTPYVPGAATFRDRLSALNSSTLALVPDRDPASLAGLLAESVADFLDATAARSGDEPIPTPWYGEGVTLPLAVANCLLLGEQLVHGYDVAKTIRRQWSIGVDEALLLIPVLETMMPIAVRPEAAKGVRAAYGVRIARGSRFLVHVDDGTVTVEPPGSRATDCEVLADPVAFVLLAYGRESQWRLLARGKVLAWGRRPWLALRFKALFFNP